MTLLYLLLGTLFGFVLSRSGAADYDMIQGMFLFERFQLYGIIGVAVLLTAPGLWLIRQHARTARGAALDFDAKPLHRGNVARGPALRHRVVDCWHVPRARPGEHRRRQALRVRGTGGRAGRRGRGLTTGRTSAPPEKP
jgi:hypothetical protein